MSFSNFLSASEILFESNDTKLDVFTILKLFIIKKANELLINLF